MYNIVYINQKGMIFLKVKCNYCGNFIEDSAEKCEYCGAANENIRRTGNYVPKTIEELKQWYIDHNLPDENTTRFFIDKDYPGPKAYGIYKQPDGDFVVYKNKADGTRSTRYVGKDETYAVQELYLKLKEEMLLQKEHNMNTSSYGSSYKSNPTNTYKNYDDYFLNGRNNNNNYSNITGSNNKNNGCLIAVIIIVVIFFILPMLFSGCGIIGSSIYRPSHSSYDSSYSSSWWDSSSSSSSSSSWDSDWSSSDWDSGWDSSSSWDSDWGSSWDSDW